MKKTVNRSQKGEPQPVRKQPEVPAARPGMGLTPTSIMALEPRMVFDGAMAAQAADTVVRADQQAVSGLESAPAESAVGSPEADLAGLAKAVAAHITVPEVAREAAQNSSEIAFVDSSLEDLSTLLAAVPDNVEIVLLDPNRDGVDQIAQALIGRREIGAIHILSHGSEGNLYLGTAELRIDNMSTAYATDMAIIRSALAVDADILIYGCEFASGLQGQAAANELARLTGADVAASSDMTGAASLLGDWQLEERTGNIEASTFDATDWDHLLVQTTINPTGGVATNGSDGLAIFVTNDGQFQVRYQNMNQYYSQGATDSSTNLFNGMYLAVGTQVIGPDTGAEGMTKVAWQSIGAQTLTGTGTVADPFIVTTGMYYDQNTNTAYDAATDTLLTVRTIYSYPNKYFTQEVTVTPPATNNSVIKFYHAMDTFLGGGDQGPAFSLNPELAITNNTSGDPSFVGVRKGVGTATESIVGFAEIAGGGSFTRYYSDVYNGANLYANGIANGGDIINTWNTNPLTDNAIAVQFTLGAISSPQTISYHIAFDGDTKLDLDADNSTATGTSYLGTFPVSTGEPVNIVDSDVQITNMIGDIADATVTLTNPQSGDALTVDTALLPAGITVEARSANTITISGIGTEADYLTALKLIKFSTTSGIVTNRSFTVEIHNQLNSVTTTASSTLSGVFSPIVDLNSGLLAVPSTNNIVVNGTFSDYADKPYGWSEAGTGITTDSAITGRYAFTANAADSLTKTGLTGLNVGPSPAGAGQLTLDLGWVNTGTNRTLTVSVAGTNYATLNTSTGALTYLNGATGSPASIAAMGSATGTLTAITINLPNTVAATGSLVFSTTAGVDDIYLDNVRLLTTVTDYTDQTSGDDWTATFTQNGSAVAISDTDADVRDGDSANMTSGVITITNAQIGDRLLVAGSTAASGTISGISYTNTGTVVTLTGSASKASYAAAIRAISFEHTTGNAQVGIVRDITVRVNDGTNPSNDAHSYITVVDPGPTLDLDSNDSAAGSFAYTTTYSEGGAPVAIADADPSITDSNDANMESATITLTNQQPGDRLLVAGSSAAFGTLPSGIAWTRTDTTVVLNGSYSIAQYQVALQLIQFESPSESPSTTPRIINTVVSDGSNNSNTAVTTINVTSIDDAPVATITPTTYAATEQTALTLKGTGLSISDVDAGSGNVTVTLSVADGQLSVTAGGSGATVSGNGTSSVTINGTVAQINALLGSDTTSVVSYINSSNSPVASTILTLSINDNGNTGSGGPLSASDTATITIQAVNDAPVATITPVSYAATEQAALTLKGTGLSVSDVDAGAASMTVTLSVTSGTLTVTTGGSGAGVSGSGSSSVTISGTAAQINALLGADPTSIVSYTNTSDAPPASATLTLAINDNGNTGTGGALTGSDSAVIDITPINDAPSGTDATLTVLEDGFYTFSAADFGFSDVDGNAFQSVTITTPPLNGTLTLGGSVVVAGQVIPVGSLSTLVFTPVANANGAGYAVFTFQVRDSGGTANGGADFDSTPNSITINVTPVNDNPVAVNDAITVAEDATATIVPVLANDTFAPDAGETLSVSAVTQPANGTVTLVSGVVRYTPNADFNGTDTFTYTVSDGNGGTATGTVTVNVTPVNDNPVAVNDAITVAEEATATIVPVLANDSFAPDVGETLSVSAVTQPANGTVTLVSGVVRYTPNADFNGTDTFTYTVSDGNGGTATGTVTVNVTPVNDNPVAVNDAITVAEDATATIVPVLANDTFAPDAGETLSVSAVTQPANGTVTLVSGVVRYTPNANFNGTDTFTYTVSDGNGGTATGTVTVTVTAVNDNPVAVNDAITIAEDATATIVPVLANDSFAPDAGETLSVSAVTQPANGTVTLVSGVVRYTPNADFNGTDTFTYTVSDGNGGTATGTVTVTVTAVNDNPVAVNDAITIAEDATATIVPVLANDSFAPDVGETLSVSAVTQPANGTVTLVSGVVRYTPNADFNGTDTFTYTVSDGNGGTATGTVTVTVTAVNDNPVAVNDAITIAEDATATIVPVLANDSFAPDAGETLSVSAVTQPANGTVTLVSGVVRYTPNANFNGTDTFTYTLSDGNGGTATGTVTVTAVNDNPVAVNDAITIAEDATATIVPVLANDSFAPDAGETLSVSAVTQPANGTVTLVSGVVRYTPNADFNGTDTFTYTVSDGNGGTATGTVTVNVTPVNDNPVAVNDAITVAEDATATIVPVLANDSFAPDAGETLSVSAVTQPANGAVTLVSGVVRYTPNADFNGTDTFTYTVSDGNGGTATGTVTVTVTAVNDNPVAVNDAITVAEDASATIVPVLANDSFAPDAGETLSVTAVTQPANGTVTLVSGVVRYTPNADFNGTDTFTYTVSDGNGGTATGTVTVTVTAVNDNPVAVNDAITVAEDASATIVPVLGNDTFAPDVGETLSVSAVTQPANGTVTLVSGVVRYTPNADFFGTDTFTYTLSDGNGGTATGTVTVNVTPVNDNPVAVNDAITVAEDASATIVPVLANDSFAPDVGETLSVSSVTQPANGTVTLVSGVVRYTPNADFNGTDTFTYTLSDGNGGTATGTVTVTVTAVNDNPVAVNDAITVAEDATATIVPVLANDTFAPDAGDTLSVSAVTQPANGTVTLVSGVVRYTPNADFNGTDTFTYTVSDGNGGTATGTVTVTVTAVNDNPVAVNDAITIAEDATATIVPVLANDSFAPDAGETLSVSAVTQPANGAVTLVSGVVRYTPNADFNGTDTFTYTLSDGNGGTATGTVTVTVTAVNDNPVAVNDAITVAEDASATIVPVLANDSFAPDAGETLSVTAVTQPANGTVTLVSGVVRYTPNADFNGTDTFTYTVSDGNGGTATGTVTVTVTAVNDNPVAVNDAITVAEDATATIVPVLANDSFAPDAGETLSVSAVTQPANGTVTLVSGVVRYTPNANFNGTDTFTYTLSDGNGGTATGTVTVTVTAVNDNPVAVNDAITVAEDATATIVPVLANDTFAPDVGETLSVSAVTQPANGTVTLVSGVVRYTPNANFNGTDTFTYTVSDGNGGTATGTVTVTVTAVNDNPVAVNDAITIAEDASATIVPVLANDSFAPDVGETLSVSAVTQPANGTVTLVSGVVRYTPNANFNGTDTFTYTLSDGNGGTATGTVTVTVTAVNDNPVAVNDAITVAEDASATIVPVLANDTFAPDAGETLSVSAVTQPANGTVTLVSGVVRYTPNADFNGTDTFTYTLSDGNGGTATGTVTVTVTAVNDNPVAVNDAITVAEDASATIVPVLANDSFAPDAGETLSVSAVTQPANGAVTLVSGVVRYTPNADFNGTDTFTYTVSDGNGGTATGTVTVTVTAVNDNPVAVNDAITVAEDASATIVPVLANDTFAPDAGETLSVTAVTQPANGTVTLVSGVVRYTPNADFNGTDTFTYTVSDGNGGTATGTVTVTVTAVNDNPVAVNDAITIAEDATATIVPVLANDTFAPDAGETLSVSAVTQPANGTVTLVSGVVRYTPNANFNGTDTFTYTLSDGNGGTATGTVTVNVTPVNDNPVAVNDAITVAEDATATIVPVLANDTFAPDVGETLSVSAVTQPANGTVTLVSGVVRYTPNANFNGTDTFTYTVSDGNGGTATGTVTVTVTAVNDNPVAVNDAITVAEDASATIVPVLANDTFAPDAGETLSVSAVTQPANGTVTLVSGVVRYTPNADFNGTDTFTYTLSDGNGGTATGTVTVTVTAVNDNPVAVNDAITVAEDASATIVPVLANDTFAPDAGETLSVSAVTQPANGTVTLVSGVVRYTPNADFNGTDTFTYTLSDGNGGTATGTVTVTVTAVNDNPVAVNDAITVAEDATATIVPVLANDSFAPDAGETLSVSAVTQPANGAVTLVSGVVRYTPNADFNGTDTFTYTLSDGNGGTATGTVTVTVTAVNDNPVAVNDAITVAEDASATIVPVLANDSFAPDAGETLSVTAVTQPANGTVTLVSGVVRYTPNADFNGTDTFTYTVSDGNGGTATGTVTVTVTAVNDNPVAVNDAITVAEDATATIVPVLANDSFAPDAGETLSVSAVTQPANGTVTLVSGVVRYTPNANFNGTDTFTYTLSDGNGGTATGTVTVTVTAVNDNPVAVNDAITVAEDATATIVPVLANDTFAPDVGETLSVSAVTQPANGTVTLVSGVVRYTPNANFNGTDTFTYTVSDGNGGTATGTVTVTVTAVNDNPVAVNDAITVAEDASATIVPVLANDTFAPDAGETLSVSAVTQPANGTVTLVSGVVRYTPNANFNGTDTFTYTVSDGNGGTATGTVTVTVTAVNDNPVAVNDAITVAEDASATIVPVLANDTFAPDAGETLSVSAVTQPANGTVTLVSGVVRYTPNADFNGTDTFTYTLSDGNGGTATGTVTVTVTAVNDNPVAVNDAITVAEDASATIVPVLANDTFAPDAGETLSVSAVTQPANGTVTLVSGVVRYTPNADFNGTDTFTYTLSDGNGGTATGTVTVTVTAVNDNPVAVNDAITVAEDASATIVPVLANDTFAPDAGETLSVSAVTQPANGTVTLVSGVVRYTPNADFNGTDTFTYTLSDGNGGTATGTVTVTVTAVNDNPVAVNDAITIAEDATATIVPVLANDTFAPDAGETLSVTAVTQPTNGTVTLVSGVVRYTPNANFNGTDTFTYTVSDGNGGTATGTVTVTVTAVNDAPTVTPIAAQSVQDGAPVTLPIAANFSDIDGDTLTYSASGLPPGLSIDPITGLISGTIASNASVGGPYTVSVTADDGRGGSVSQSFTWIVANATPVVTTGIPDQTGGASRPFSLDVSTNFRDGGLDRDTLAFTANGLPAGLTIDPVSGLISGTLPIDAAGLGPYVIKITASDGQGGTVSTSFTLTAINDAPVARPDIVTVQQFVTVRISPLANDSDPEGAPLSIVSATASTGSVTINADGTLTYTPASISTGPDVITYTISDGHGGFSTSTVTVEILSGSTFIYSPSGVTDTIPQLPVGNSPQISTEGIVVSTVESFGLGGRFGSLSTDRIVVSSVNRAGSLNGTADLGGTQNPLSAVYRSVEELRHANSLHDRGAGSSGTWSPEGMTGFALHSIAGEQSIDRGIAGSHKIVIEAMVRERALHIQMRDFLFTGSTGSRGWAPSREPAQFTVTLADGRALPDWLSSGGKGLLIGQRPADIEKLELRVVATFADGTSVTRYVRIDAHTGEISQIGEKRAQIEMPKTLSRQFAEAAPMGIDTGELAKLLPL